MGDHIPDGLRPALLPLVETIGELTARIAAAGREVDALCEAYPETSALRQVTGVGPITTLTFVLTIEDPGRFPKNREVGLATGVRSVGQRGRLGSCAGALARMIDRQREAESMRAIVPLRVSTDDHERDGAPLDTQGRACREFVSPRGWRVVR